MSRVWFPKDFCVTESQKFVTFGRSGPFLLDTDLKIFVVSNSLVSSLQPLFPSRLNLLRCVLFLKKRIRSYKRSVNVLENRGKGAGLHTHTRTKEITKYDPQLRRFAPSLRQTS